MAGAIAEGLSFPMGNALLVLIVGGLLVLYGVGIFFLGMKKLHRYQD